MCKYYAMDNLKSKIRKLMEEEIGSNSICFEMSDKELDDYIHTYIEYLCK